MTQQILDAIYENGVFRPLKRPQIEEGQQVRIVIEVNATLAPDDILQLSAQVYQGLSTEEVDEIEQIAHDRQKSFDERSE
ncbi:MAG: antitoxin family protein [Myxacorys chilensis ATA2-1-KO14]|jgi:predicted DNA-binding antitoxin AbrB/MazE fold protein|nr:antitoxin family protein [Myxacorys chilensis ATA2-1-KO14]